MQRPVAGLEKNKLHAIKVLKGETETAGSLIKLLVYG